MRQWKEAGRAGRDDEADLWKRFRDAQDKFFAARSEVFAAKETELRAHASVKEQLLAEAQALLPITDWRAARSVLRGIQERWGQQAPCRGRPATSWSRDCAGSRKRCGAPRTPSGSGPTRRRCRPRAGHGRPAADGDLDAGDAAGQGAGAGRRGRHPQGRRSPRGPAVLATEAERTLGKFVDEAIANADRCSWARYSGIAIFSGGWGSRVWPESNPIGVTREYRPLTAPR